MVSFLDAHPEAIDSATILDIVNASTNGAVTPFFQMTVKHLMFGHLYVCVDVCVWTRMCVCVCVWTRMWAVGCVYDRTRVSNNTLSHALLTHSMSHVSCIYVFLAQRLTSAVLSSRHQV